MKITLACQGSITFILSLIISSSLAEPLPSLDCLLEPNMVVELSSPAAGVIASVPVDRSDTVKRGQVVAKLISKAEFAKAKLAKARALYEVDLESRQANYQFNLKENQRIRELYSADGISLNEKDQSDTNLQLSKLELEKAKHEQQIRKYEREYARANLSMRSVRSPIDGVVVDRFLMPGEFVQNTPIVKLAQLDPLRVEVISPVAHFGHIKTGMHAAIESELKQFSDLVAEVVVVDSMIDAASGTFGVRLELPNKDNRIPSGLKCTVRFFTASEEARYNKKKPTKGNNTTVVSKL